MKHAVVALSSFSVRAQCTVHIAIMTNLICGIPFLLLSFSMAKCIVEMVFLLVALILLAIPCIFSALRSLNLYNVNALFYFIISTFSLSNSFVVELCKFEWSLCSWFIHILSFFPLLIMNLVGVENIFRSKKRYEKISTKTCSTGLLRL